MNKPKTTLFMLSSVDGKISTGDTDKLDFDQDLPKIKGLKTGLKQYYKLEQETDLNSLNSGRVLAKIGINKKQRNIKKTPVTFLVIDNNSKLSKTGVENLIKKSKKLFIITTDKKHPAFSCVGNETLEILYFEKKVDFKFLFHALRVDFGIKKLTIQTGGTLNAILLREDLVDELHLVMAPTLIGGKDTSSLIDGESLHKTSELKNIKTMKLIKADVLKNSYLSLKYKINKK